MSEMVERVSAALMQRYIASQAIGAVVWEDMARAALEAMREPTDAVLKAGAVTWDDDWCTETNALNMWNGMIDEALK